jgi:hypothetical protein
MTDLEIAKSELYDENLTLTIVKNGTVLFTTKSNPVSGFLDAADKCGDKLEDASLAVRVAGKALALLCAYAKIGEVFSAVTSRKAQAVFKAHKISVHWNTLADSIPNDAKAGSCPFEKSAADITDPQKALCAFKKLLLNAKACPTKTANGLYRSKRKEL